MRTLDDPQALAALTVRLQRLVPGRPRVWGTMSAHQMAVHLGDAAAAVLKQREFRARPRSASRLAKLLALYLMPRWPHGVRAGADPASVRVDAPTFASDLARAVANLQLIATAPADALAERHPMFGPMSRADWTRWAYLHTDHHLRQFGL